jgi:hypothetical protein
LELELVKSEINCQDWKKICPKVKEKEEMVVKVSATHVSKWSIIHGQSYIYSTNRKPERLTTKRTKGPRLSSKFTHTHAHTSKHTSKHTHTIIIIVTAGCRLHP